MGIYGTVPYSCGIRLGENKGPRAKGQSGGPWIAVISIALLELTCPLDSVHNIQSARSRKQNNNYNHTNST